MRILYGIQGTGNGHLTRAAAIIPFLQLHGDVDVLLSGTQVDIELPYPVKYRYHGLSFIFGKKGGIDYVETYKKSNVKKLFNDIQQLPVLDYDIVISDFEPVTAWACYLKNKPCIGLSNQVASINKHAPKPAKTDLIGKLVLKYYAPAKYRYGFHFLPYAKNIFTPIIRKEIRELKPEDNNYYTVYLPAYSEKKLVKVLSRFPNINWQVFSKHTKDSSVEGNISIMPISNDAFVESIEGATGVLCAAGFATTSEVIYLQKKLAVIPMKGQYEQHCNAAALKMLGIPIIKNLKQKHLSQIQKWLDNNYIVHLDYPDETQVIIQNIIEAHKTSVKALVDQPRSIDTAGKFRNLLLEKIFSISK